MSNTFIYGASGHGKVVLDLLSLLNRNVSSFIDDNIQLNTFQGYKVLNYIPENASFIIGIGNNRIRKEIMKTDKGSIMDALIHPTAIVSNTTILGKGTMIAAGVVVNTDAVIKSNCIINTSSVIEHDCYIEDFAHISPNATLCGGVTIGEGTHIGAAAVVVPGVKIGSWCTIGAGSVVINDVPDGATAVGNPARIIKMA